jgi:hypothetical protein
MNTARKINPISPRQIKAIHAIKGKLGLDDDAYRDILQSRFKAASCKFLTWMQAEELLETLNGGGPSRPAKPQRRPALKYQDMDSRPGFASSAQLRLIDAMFSQVTRAEGEEAIEKALNSFVNRIAHVAGLRMLKSWQVEKIVKALEAMGAEHKNKEA